MDEPVEEPEPPAVLSEELGESVMALSPNRLRKLIEFAQSLLQFKEAPISELIEPGENEEIVRMEDYGYYTVVIKRQKTEDGQNGPLEPPHVYIVTLEPEVEGGHHLHWENIGPVVE